MQRLMFFLALFAVGATDATVLRKGELACRNERALAQLQEAHRSGDERTVGWLMNGACIVIPEDTPVTVLASEIDGNSAYRTTERRRNVTLWANQASTGTTPAD